MTPSGPVSRAGAATLAGGVVVWRILAYRQPSSLIEQATGFALPLAAVGLGFVVAGLIVYLSRPGPAASLYLAWCLCSGVHWGGAVGAAAANLELSLLLLYIGVSAFGEAALLRLALLYPSASRTSSRVGRLLFVPGVAGVAVAPLAGALPTELLRALAGVLLLAASALGVGAGAVFIVRLLRADRKTRRDNRLGIVVACLLVAGVASWLPGLGLPGPSDAYGLLSVLAPAGLGYALLRRPG